MKSYESLEDIRKEFVPLGFKEYDPTRFDHTAVVTRFQKQYDDEVGKRYFIDIVVYDFTFTSVIPAKYTTEFQCQLYKKGTHDAMNIEFLDWTLDQVEKFIDNMFQSEMIEYYETWEES